MKWVTQEINRMVIERTFAKEALRVIFKSRKSIFRVGKIHFKVTQPPCFHPLMSTLSNLLEGRWTFFFFLLTAKRRLKVAQGRSDRGSWDLEENEIDSGWQILRRQFPEVENLFKRDVVERQQGRPVAPRGAPEADAAGLGQQRICRAHLRWNSVLKNWSIVAVLKLYGSVSLVAET